MHMHRISASGRVMLALLVALTSVAVLRAQGATPPASPPGSTVWANFDFVPGARVLFAEDFTHDKVGNFPQRLALSTGNMEVVEFQSKRWLRVTNTGSGAAFEVPLAAPLPQRFTMEFDLTIPWDAVSIYSSAKYDGMGTGPDRPTSTIVLGGTEAGINRGGGDQGSNVDPRSLFEDFFAAEGDAISRVFKVPVEVDGRYVKVYLDQQCVVNMPNANFGRANKIIFDFGATDNEKKMPVLISSISINAGGKGLYDALSTTGRVTTQGIYFSVGSATIRGESTPTLAEIGAMLKDHAVLNLTIEGHTDNTGDAAANQALSLKRAQAIVAYLTSTFGIDASRLLASGLGATKPAASNDTFEGRQSNRRVELVKR